MFVGEFYFTLGSGGHTWSDSGLNIISASWKDTQTHCSVKAIKSSWGIMAENIGRLPAHYKTNMFTDNPTKN